MVGAPGLEPEIGRLKVCCDTVSPHPRYLITLVTCHDRSPFKKIKIARDLARQGRVWLCLVPPERFELPAPAFVAQCSNPNELRWCVGAPRQNRTAITGLQNQCTTIVLVGRIVGGATETRTQKPAFTDRWISNPLQYHYGTAPLKYLAGGTCV